MREVTLEELLEAGCHFGHQVTRQNPKARDFVFEARDNIHIIDLEKTKEGLDAALSFVYDVAARGGTMLIVGTKRQAQGILKGEIQKAVEKANQKKAKVKDEVVINKPSEIGIYSVTNRWIGGTLTNFSEVAKNYAKLKDLTARLQNEFERAKYTKKEIGMWEKERVKLDGFYAGVVDMEKMPDVLFIVDTHNETLAVNEAVATGIPTIGVVDTNADPTVIDYPIPANDDAVGSIQLLTSAVLDVWLEGKFEPKKEKEEKKISDAGEESNKSDGKASEASKKKAATKEKEEKTTAKPKQTKKKE